MEENRLFGPRMQEKWDFTEKYLEFVTFFTFGGSDSEFRGSGQRLRGSVLGVRGSEARRYKGRLAGRYKVRLAGRYKVLLSLLRNVEQVTLLTS